MVTTNPGILKRIITIVEKTLGLNQILSDLKGLTQNMPALDDKIDGYHYHLSVIKFGIGRTTSDAAHEIRDGKITREEV